LIGEPLGKAQFFGTAKVLAAIAFKETKVIKTE
jgi:hypothetical protein